MKLKIETTPQRNVVLEYTPDGQKAPLKATLSREQVDMLVTLLTTARKADTFTFELET